MNYIIIIVMILLLVVGYVIFTKMKSHSVNGRFIILRQPAIGSLNLAEIEVFSNGQNITNQAVVTKSSGYQGDVFPNKNFIDGDMSNFVHSSGSDSPMIQLDFGKNVNIDKIMLYNRTDCCQGRINGIVLTITSDTGKEIYKANPIADINGNAVYTEESKGSYTWITYRPPNPVWVGQKIIM